MSWEARRNTEGELLDDWVGRGAELPEDLLSVTLFASTEGAPMLSIGVSEPDGRMLIDVRRPELSLNRLLRGRGSVVGVIPAASAALPLASNFQVRAGRLEGDPRADDLPALRVTAWLKRSGRGPAPPRAQELPLTLFLVGELPDDARLATALGEAGRIWRAAGVELREPARVRLAGDVAAPFRRLTIDPALGSDSPSLAALLRLSAGRQGTLPLFVVGDIVTSGPGVGIWALSGSIPVPPVAGTARSGIAVSWALVEVDPVRAGQVIAHEIGHALGLYHSTERETDLLGRSLPRQAVHDLLDDTPGCPLDEDRAPRDGVLSATECEAHDAANLMFWAGVPGGTRLTPGQAEIARRAALTR